MSPDTGTPHGAGAESPRLPDEDRRRLDELLGRVGRASRYFVGYPSNEVFDYTELTPFLGYVLNNVGDPFAETNVPLNTHEFEREVMEDFAEFTRAPEGDWWGYVTGGGTEGNMYGLYLARELFPEGICYFSEESHYSVPKILRLQHTRNIMLKAQANGEIDYADLAETLRIHRDVPPIIFANIGTTMKGAHDDLAKIRQILADLAITHCYIHADAALSGMVLPFVENRPAWDFAGGADSISISGHKLLGAPVPCGVVLARRPYVDRVARSVEYVGALDTTITGSRSAFGPLMLWYRLRTLGREGCRRLVRRCLDLADFAIERFEREGIHAWRNPHSITVVIPRPPASFLEKWVVAVHGDIGHIITLPHVTEEIIEEIVGDLAAAFANPSSDAS